MPEDTPTDAEQKPKGKLPLKTIIMIAAVVAMEAGTVIGFKMMHEKEVKPADASTPIAQTETATTREMTEITLCENTSVDNYISGNSRTVVTLEVVARIETAKKEQVTKLIEDNSTQLKDRIRTLVASSQPDHIRDPRLQVIKREIKMEIDKIIGEGHIDEVLIPVWQSYNQD